MQLIDTHSHLYLEEFDSDQDVLISAAKASGIEMLLLPNVDIETIDRMHTLCDKHPEFTYPMIGLHPTSVKANYTQDLKTIESWLNKRNYCGIGEIGIDLYWDKTYRHEQMIVLQRQFEWAVSSNLPVIIHCREGLDEILEVLDSMSQMTRGVFHSFGGTVEDVERIRRRSDFYLRNGFRNTGVGKSFEGVDYVILQNGDRVFTLQDYEEVLDELRSAWNRMPDEQ